VEACRIREAEVWNKRGISMDVAWNKTCGVHNVSTRWLRGLRGGKIVTLPPVYRPRIPDLMQREDT
jgi:hypothetical protein